MSLPTRPVASGLTPVAVAHFHGSNDATESRLKKNRKIMQKSKSTQ